MPSYSKNEVILVRYPFSALSGVKVRPAIVVNAPHVSQDVFIVPLTSRTTSLLAGGVCPYRLGSSRTPRANGGETWAVYGARDARAQMCWPAHTDGR